MKKYFAFFVLILIGTTSCLESNKNQKKEEKTASNKTMTIVQKVDAAATLLQEATKSHEAIAVLDHHRMAEELDVYTPPAIAFIFSDKKTNSELVKENQLIGLDFPYKFLCFSESDTINAKIAYTSSEFIQKRHDLNKNMLENYNSNLNTILNKLPKEMISYTDVSSVNKGFGIVNIKSDFDYKTTVKNLKTIVMSQGDTKWFADVDYQKEALEFSIEIRPTVLLLFGGPAPGGKAMMTSPKIGLDAFCQKLLVYENESGEVWIAYNDIVAFANLYYQTSTKPQQLINQRLKMTFTKAISLQEEF